MITKMLKIFKIGILIPAILIVAATSEAAVKYVRTDGGPGGTTSTTCNGTQDVAFTGSNGPNCAFNHPNWPLPSQNGSWPDNPTTFAISAADTVVIAPGTYIMGCQGTSSCVDASKNYTVNIGSATYDAGYNLVPSGTGTSTHTKVYGCSTTGCGAGSKPVLVMVGRMDTLFALDSKSYITFKDIEITDQWGADGECAQGFPRQNCGRSAFAASGNWHDLTFEGMDIHGLTQHGFGKWGGPGAGGSNAKWNITDSNIDGNKSAGIDMDNCGNNGQCGITGDINFTNVNMRWNGCSEAYPVVWGADGVNGKVGRLPTNSGCREGNNGGYGDMIGTSDTGGTWKFTGCNFSHNTSDAIDLLYCGRNDRAAYGNCTLIVKRSVLEGNNGQAVKGPEPWLEDNLIIGNCSYWGQSATTYDAAGFSPCRATGTPVSIQFRRSPAQQTKMYNNTIVSHGDVMFGYESGGQTTCGFDTRNNILIGGYDFHGEDETAMYYTETCTGGTISESYNLCYGPFKSQYTHCTGSNDQNNVDPLLVGSAYTTWGTSGPSTTGYYTGTQFIDSVLLQSGSPARNTADETISGADAVDRNNFDRGASWDLGGYEFGTVEGSGPSPTCGNNVTESPEVCDGTDINSETCVTQGFSSGTLACLGNCSDYDTSACVAASCGDGNIDAGEQCDCDGGGCTAAELNNQTCVSRGYSTGTLSCSGSCQFDETGCANFACQNGTLDPGEECDDNNSTEGDGCSSICEIENVNYEKFLTYTETDPNSKYQVRTHRVNVAALGRSESANIKVDKGAGNIGDFSYSYTLSQEVCSDSTGSAVVYDAGSEDTGISVASDTFAHTVSAGDNRLLVVSVGREEFGTNRTINSVTYAGSPMTFGVSRTTAAGNNKMSMYYMLNPPVGTANVVVTYSAAVGATITSADSWQNIVQQAPEVTSTSDQGANNFTTITPNALAINAMVAGLSSATTSTTDDQRHNFANSGQLKMGVSSKTVINAGATSMTWSVSSGDWATTVLVFKSMDTGGNNPAIMGVMSVGSASYSNLKAQETATDGFGVYISCRSSVSQNTWTLANFAGGLTTDTFNDANYNITRYGLLERSGTTLTNKVYSDEQRTSLLDTQTVTTTATTHRYISVAPSYNDTTAGTSFTGNVRDVDLTAGSPPPANPATESFIINGYTITGTGMP